MAAVVPDRFRWRLSEPLLSPLDRPGDPCFSVKDPTVVYSGGRWHVFCTIRSRVRSHQIEYIAFDEWENVSQAERHLLRCREGYFCAPQVFFFRPHEQWYLVYQVGEQGRKLGLQPAFSTTTTVGDPASWSPAELFFPNADPEGVERWIDFWVICDDDHAYLFFTSLDGRLWRMSTPLPDFPRGFSNATCVLTDIHPEWRLFEASHTYRLRGSETYLTVVEAENRLRDNRRFYLSFLANRLDGDWEPVAASVANPFASADNVSADGELWAEHVSHGELLRAGVDERLEVDPQGLRFLIQGVRAEQFGGRPYGEIPWRLGILSAEIG